MSCVRGFTRHAATGAYLRVIAPGEIRAGDPIEIVHRPDHRVTCAMALRAVTFERDLLPEILAAGEALHSEARRVAQEYVAAVEERERNRKGAERSGS